MSTKLILLVQLTKSQKEFGGGSAPLSIGKTVEEECASEPLSFYDIENDACSPCEPYTHADDSGRACA